MAAGMISGPCRGGSCRRSNACPVTWQGGSGVAGGEQSPPSGKQSPPSRGAIPPLFSPNGADLSVGATTMAGHDRASDLEAVFVGDAQSDAAAA